MVSYAPVNGQDPEYDVVGQVDFTVNGSDSFDTQQTGNSDTNATSGIITRTTITLTQAEADDIVANDYFRLRIQRVVSDGDDDMSDDAQIIKVSLRV